MNDSNDNTKGYPEEILRSALRKLGYKGNDTDGDLATLAKKYYKEFTEAEKKLPYWINVVEAMNGSRKNENGHTRFLHKLLRYTSNNTLPILNSFMNRFTDKKDIKYKPKQDKIIVNKKFDIDGQDRYPDIYINRIGTGNGSETISAIFENKIDDANDREGQVEDYIRRMYRDRHNNCENEGLDNNCYAFYLIADKLSKRSDDDNHDMFGRQKVSSDVLGRLISDDHYILLSYKDDILPWLKNEVLVSLKEKYLTLNIRLYIQYLENRFGLREDVNSVKLDTLKNIDCMESLSLKELCALQNGLDIYISKEKQEFKDEIIKKCNLINLPGGDKNHYINKDDISLVKDNKVFLKVEIYDKKTYFDCFFDLHCNTDMSEDTEERIKGIYPNIKIYREDGFSYSSSIIESMTVQNTIELDDFIKLFESNRRKLLKEILNL